MIEGGNVYTRGSKEASLGITEDHSQFYQELGENFSDKGNSKHKAMKQKKTMECFTTIGEPRSSIK